MPRITITVPEHHSQPYSFNLDRQVVSFGRGGSNDIVIESASVSVSHATMRRVLGGYELHDADSTNGIKLNGIRQNQISLINNINVTIGDAAFDFMLSDEEIQALAKENRQAQCPIIHEQEELSIPQIKPQAKRAAYSEPVSNGMNLGSAFMFFVLAGLAFFTGLAVRHQKDTGTSLIDAIRLQISKGKIQDVSANPMAPQSPAPTSQSPGAN